MHRSRKTEYKKNNLNYIYQTKSLEYSPLAMTDFFMAFLRIAMLFFIFIAFMDFFIFMAEA